MIRFIWLLIAIILIYRYAPSAIATSSEYVLPYPSFMPGSFFYRPHLIWERIARYWYFGNFSQFEYNLKQSDKYLVEAKTLFEYKQYLLGFKALQKSNSYFEKISLNLINAQKENKNIIQKQNKLKEAALKHIEVLNSIKQQVPSSFIWQPEKAPPTTLDLHKEIDLSIQTRKQAL